MRFYVVKRAIFACRSAHLSGVSGSAMLQALRSGLDVEKRNAARCCLTEFADNLRF